jgi:hypothetical protein
MVTDIQTWIDTLRIPKVTYGEGKGVMIIDDGQVDLELQKEVENDDQITKNIEHEIEYPRCYDIKKHRITPIYSLLSFLGAGLIIISYIASILSIFLKQSIPWRGRTSHISNNKTR